jgi:hypothetical protein
MFDSNFRVDYLVLIEESYPCTENIECIRGRAFGSLYFAW